MSENKAPGDENLKSLNKVATILDCFSTTHRAMSLADICKLTGYPRSTTHRLLASMREVGLLDQDRERERYRLGIKLFAYGNIVLANLDLHREARPYAEALGRITGLSVHLAVFGGERAVVIHRAEPAPGGLTPLNLLENAPVHCTSIGKAILAHQPESVLERLIEAGLPRYTDFDHHRWPGAARGAAESAGTRLCRGQWRTSARSALRGRAHPRPVRPGVCQHQRHRLRPAVTAGPRSVRGRHGHSPRQPDFQPSGFRRKLNLMA